MEKIYELQFDCGRQGELTGKFVADSEDVKILIDSKLEVYFGEVLGKHSEVCGTIEPTELVLVSEEENVIKLFKDNHFESGFNPFNYSINNGESILGEDFEDDLTVLQAIEIIKSRKR